MLITLLLGSGDSTAYAQNIDTFPPKAPSYKHNWQTGLSSSTSLTERLAHLEQAVFGTTYPDHDLEARLGHLDEEILGVKTIGSVSARLTKLEEKVGLQTAFGSGYGAGISSEHADNASSDVLADPDYKRFIEAIPLDVRAGDYYSSISPVYINEMAHWSKFPVRVHLPQESPRVWGEALEEGLKQWTAHVPMIIVSPNETADIDVVWVNHLVPKLLGVTRLIFSQGKMRVQIFVLRPSFYLSEVPERALNMAFLHELGHALGILGHSDSPEDVMYTIELSDKNEPSNRSWSRNAVISPRDWNTLRRIYQSPALSGDFTAPHPLEWGSNGGL